MDIEQAKVKLDSISKSTATKHPKVLVAELCAVVKFLLNEIDRIKFPEVSVLYSELPKELGHDSERQVSIQLPVTPEVTMPPVLPPRKRSGNAGDAV